MFKELVLLNITGFPRFHCFRNKGPKRSSLGQRPSLRQLPTGHVAGGHPSQSITQQFIGISKNIFRAHELPWGPHAYHSKALIWWLTICFSRTMITDNTQPDQKKNKRVTILWQLKNVHEKIGVCGTISEIQPILSSRIPTWSVANTTYPRIMTRG